MSIEDELKALKERMDYFEPILETQERLFATLLTSYTEVFALVEVLVAQVMGTHTEDEQTEFLKEFQKLRTDLLTHLQQGAQPDGDMDKPNPDLASAMERLVAQRRAHRPDPEPF